MNHQPDECERECVFEDDPADPDPVEPWHYRRTCASCGGVWYGLHCKHDGHQNPCPWCGVRPEPMPLRD